MEAQQDQGGHALGLQLGPRQKPLAEANGIRERPILADRFVKFPRQFPHLRRADAERADGLLEISLHLAGSFAVGHGGEALQGQGGDSGRGERIALHEFLLIVDFTPAAAIGQIALPGLQKNVFMIIIKQIGRFIMRKIILSLLVIFVFSALWLAAADELPEGRKVKVYIQNKTLKGELISVTPELIVIRLFDKDKDKEKRIIMGCPVAGNRSGQSGEELRPHRQHFRQGPEIQFQEEHPGQDPGERRRSFP